LRNDLILGIVPGIIYSLNMKSTLDHLLLGIADLDQGIEWVQEKTGVRAIPGGNHPGAGTRNALLSLGNHRYLEIIALDPKQNPTGRMATLLHDLAAPRLITWAAATSNIDSIRLSAQAAGYRLEGPSDGARQKTDGHMLRWKTIRLSDFDDAIPFFIEWAPGIVHPSEDSPSGCLLEEFEICHPEARRIREIFDKLGIEAAVNEGDLPQLGAILSTPKGQIAL
jgi:hypothetical protein